MYDLAIRKRAANDTRIHAFSVRSKAGLAEALMRLAGPGDCELLYRHRPVNAYYRLMCACPNNDQSITRAGIGPRVIDAAWEQIELHGRVEYEAGKAIGNTPVDQSMRDIYPETAENTQAGLRIV